MISDAMMDHVAHGSAIRAMFEEGKQMADKYGAENVYDFSLGNPYTPAPEEIKKAILDIINEESPVVVHGYMNNAGFPEVREKIAEDLNRRFGTAFAAENLIMTVGAAGGLNVILKTLLNPGDEVLTFTPFFGEYRSYVANYNGKLVTVNTDPVTFMPDTADLASKITKRTKALIINNPNNPTGVVYPEDVIKEVAKVLSKKEEELGTDIYLISDEPYRELFYGDVKVPFLTKYYKNTIVGYSFSKSLSLPGERIGYLAIPSEISDFENVMCAASVANRILGYVNAPSLFQKVVAASLDAKTDIEFYDENRTMLYDALIEDGFSCTKPDGAFYMWVKSPEEDEKKFCERAKEERIIIVPGSTFGCPGYVRLAYCVSHDTIKNSLPGFKKLAEYYGLS